MYSTHGEQEMVLSVVSRKYVADGVLEFEFCQANGEVLPAWDPGAHADFRLANGLVRQYSLMRGVTAFNNWRIAVVIEAYGRGGSKFLDQEIHEGDSLSVLGPRNHFPLLEADSYHFIAGGIGITPLIPMIEKADSRGADWYLSYLGRSRTTMAYVSELEARFPDHIEVFAKDGGARFSTSSDLRLIGDAGLTYSCGPEKLLEALESEFEKHGISTSFHAERFKPKAIELTEPDTEFTVYCAKSDVSLVVAADESILMAADAEGIEITGDCMEGTCGSCETRVLKGQVSHRDSVMTKDAQAANETMMICVSRAIGKSLELDL